MIAQNSKINTYIPDGKDMAQALARTTHLAVGAHQDDIEIFAYHGIAECYGMDDKWFAGITMTNGSGSPRTGSFAKCTDEDMMAIREEEQNKAALLGEYSVQFQMGLPSSEIKDASNNLPVDDLYEIFDKAEADIIYLHNPADKHDTHVAVLAKSIAALRRLPKEKQPKELYGCEVWRGLDWLMDEDKVALACSKHAELAKDLIALYESQIAGGKRYDLATAGRRLANATYHDSHGCDNETYITWAIDLMPLLKDDTMSIGEFIIPYIQRLEADVSTRAKQFCY